MLRVPQAGWGTSRARWRTPVADPALAADGVTPDFELVSHAVPTTPTSTTAYSGDVGERTPTLLPRRPAGSAHTSAKPPYASAFTPVRASSDASALADFGAVLRGTKVAPGESASAHVTRGEGGMLTAKHGQHSKGGVLALNRVEAASVRRGLADGGQRGQASVERRATGGKLANYVTQDGTKDTQGGGEGAHEPVTPAQWWQPLATQHAALFPRVAGAQAYQRGRGIGPDDACGSAAPQEPLPAPTGARVLPPGQPLRAEVEAGRRAARLRGGSDTPLQALPTPELRRHVATVQTDRPGSRVWGPEIANDGGGVNQVRLTPRPQPRPRPPPGKAAWFAKVENQLRRRGGAPWWRESRARRMQGCTAIGRKWRLKLPQGAHADAPAKGDGALRPAARAAGSTGPGPAQGEQGSAAGTAAPVNETGTHKQHSDLAVLPALYPVPPQDGGRRGSSDAGQRSRPRQRWRQPSAAGPDTARPHCLEPRANPDVTDQPIAALRGATFKPFSQWTQQVSSNLARLSHNNPDWWRVVHDKHGFNRREIISLLARFKALVCLGNNPNGIIRDVFRTGMPLLAAEDRRFIDRVYKVLDSNNSGVIEWPEFVYAIACLEKGSLEQRADFIFRVFDNDGDGEISMGEVDHYFDEGKPASAKPKRSIGHRITEYVVRKMFHSLGMEEARDSITREEFVRRIVKSGQTPEEYGLFGKTTKPQPTARSRRKTGVHGIPHEEFWARRLARRNVVSKESQFMKEVEQISAHGLEPERQRAVEEQARHDSKMNLRW